MKIEKYESLNPLYFNKHNKLDYDCTAILKDNNIKVRNSRDYGVISYNKEIIIPIEYESIILDDLYVCKKHDTNKYDIYDKNKIIFKNVLKYRFIDNFIIISSIEGSYEVYDKAYNLVNRFESKDFFCRKDGFFKYENNGQFGVRYILGKIIIEAEYDSISFQKDLIKAVKNNKVEYFDFQGNKKLNRKYKQDSICYLGEGIFLFNSLNKQKLINKDGQILRILEKKFYVNNFEDGFALYHAGDEANYMNINCNDVFNTDFSNKCYRLYPISKNRWIYTIPNETSRYSFLSGMIDNNQNEILPPIYHKLEACGDYIIAQNAYGAEFLFNYQGEDILKKDCRRIYCINEEMNIFGVNINGENFIYDGINLNKIKNDSSGFYIENYRMKGSKYLKYSVLLDLGLLDINGKIIIPHYFKSIDYNDYFMILDGYLLPFEFSKNSNIKLTLDDIIYYNLDIILNDKTITKKFKRVEEREKFISELMKIDEMRNVLKAEIDEIQDNKLYEMFLNNDLPKQLILK